MPQPGASFPTGYIYIDVPWSTVRQQTPQFNIFASGEPYGSIEAFAKGRCLMGVMRRDHIDRSRVYRFPNTALPHFTEDKCNPGEYYLEVGITRFPVVTTDPGVSRGVVRSYAPIG